MLRSLVVLIMLSGCGWYDDRVEALAREHRTTVGPDGQPALYVLDSFEAGRYYPHGYEVVGPQLIRCRP